MVGPVVAVAAARGEDLPSFGLGDRGGCWVFGEDGWFRWPVVTPGDGVERTAEREELETRLSCVAGESAGRDRR